MDPVSGTFAGFGLIGSSGIAVSSCSVLARADKDWQWNERVQAKKVWCSGLGLCLEMSPVFDFGQGLRCGLCFRHCRCHWIMAAWELSCFLTLFFLVPLCWYAVSKRQMLLFSFFEVGLVGVNKHLCQMVSLVTSMTPPLNYIFVILRQCRCYSKTKTTIKILSKTRRKISSISSMAKLKDSRWFLITRWRMYFINACSVQGVIC